MAVVRRERASQRGTSEELTGPSSRDIAGAELSRLRDADPAAWHHAASVFAVLSQRLESVHTALRSTGADLRGTWPAGAAAAVALDRLETQASAVVAAHAPAQRVATALREHAHSLASLRGLAHQPLDPAQAIELLARARDLDARISAVLAQSVPAPLPARWAATGPGRLAPAPVLLTTLEAQRGRPPEQVRDWWRGLTAEQRAWAIRDFPAFIGWLDGVPAVDRDQANRALLERRLTQLSAREADLVEHLNRRAAGVPGVGGPLPAMVLLLEQLDDVRAELTALQTVRAALSGHGDQALLLGIDPGGDGRVVVALGNPDHARYTAVLVPGANADLLDTPGGVERVQRLWQEADALVSGRAEPWVDGSVPSGDVSAVYWLGYDAPDSAGSVLDGAARDGAPRLVGFVDGLRATHDAMPQQITVIGHSYGSTVLAEAALIGQLRVSDIVTVGSPGMHADRATELGLDPRHVWGGLAADDQLGGALGELPFVHGEEPTDPAFGANRFQVDTLGHGGYWEPNSSSLRSQAAIVVGRYDLVPLVHGTAPDLALHGSGGGYVFQ